MDACAETFLDSIRIMCCCLLPDEAEQQRQAPKVSKVPEPSDQLPLLTKIHPDDAGKKCLVLDLDETLVHSSFRAVPGADFVIPVQVRYKKQTDAFISDDCRLRTLYTLYT